MRQVSEDFNETGRFQPTRYGHRLAQPRSAAPAPGTTVNSYIALIRAKNVTTPDVHILPLFLFYRRNKPLFRERNADNVELEDAACPKPLQFLMKFRRQSKDESENDILNHILSTAGTTKEIHAHAHKAADDAHLILDSEMDHTIEIE